MPGGQRGRRGAGARRASPRVRWSRTPDGLPAAIGKGDSAGPEGGRRAPPDKRCRSSRGAPKRRCRPLPGQRGAAGRAAAPSRPVPPLWKVVSGRGAAGARLPLPAPPPLIGPPRAQECEPPFKGARGSGCRQCPGALVLPAASPAAAAPPARQPAPPRDICRR